MDGCLCFVLNVSQVMFAKDEHDVACQGHVSRNSACDAEPKWLSSAFAHTRMAGMSFLSLIATGVTCMYVLGVQMCTSLLGIVCWQVVISWWRAAFSLDQERGRLMWGLYMPAMVFWSNIH
jgi:hypothetical protein